MGQTLYWTPGTEMWTRQTSLLSRWLASCLLLFIHSSELLRDCYMACIRMAIGNIKKSNVSLLKDKHISYGTFTLRDWESLRVFTGPQMALSAVGDTEEEGSFPVIRECMVCLEEGKPQYLQKHIPLVDHLYFWFQVSLYAQQGTWCPSALLISIGWINV